jgi:hypothetical protein
MVDSIWFMWLGLNIGYGLTTNYMVKRARQGLRVPSEKFYFYHLFNSDRFTPEGERSRRRAMAVLLSGPIFLMATYFGMHALS